jgi:hypothetical protein
MAMPQLEPAQMEPAQAEPPQLESMTSATPDASLELETANRRLQSLVGELLATNQELRFKIVALETQVGQAKRGLSNATRWAGMLLP